MLRRFLVSIVALAAWVTADTETIFFDVLGRGGASDRPKDTPTLNSLGPYNSSFNFDDNQSIKEAHIPLDDVPPGRYWAWVCWSAVLPADISIHFDNESRSVVVSASREEVVLLNAHQSDRNWFVPYQVHLSPVIWGFLPVALFPMIAGVTAALVVGFITSHFFVRKII